jgi:hypothetical protein
MVDFTRRLALVRTQEDGSQTLLLADLSAQPPLRAAGHPSARLEGRISSVAGEHGSTTETYTSLATSPSNHYMVASSVLSGSGGSGESTFVDLNNNVYRMDDGSHVYFVNERLLDDLNPANLHSPVYNAWVEEARQQTTDPRWLAGLANDSLQVVRDGYRQQVGPLWSARDTFFLGYRITISSPFFGADGHRYTRV